MSSKGRIELHSTGRKLTSYEELLTLTDKKMRRSHHVLICGNAGSGKTTLMSKLAYEWAKSVDDGKTDSQQGLTSILNQMTLVFVLDIHKLSSNETLPMAIERQILRGVSVDDIDKALNTLQKGCLIVLDGYDEMRKGTIHHVLEDEILSECFVIVTTRMHKVDDFCLSQTEKYSIVKLSGFSRDNSFKYIKKFFSQEYFSNPVGAQTLIQHIRKTPFLAALSSIPILLLMICLLWENVQKKTAIVMNSMTNLYQEALSYLNKPFETRSKATDGHDLLVRLGKPALDNLFENNLCINQEEFDNKEILEHGCLIGILFLEEGLRRNDASVTFIHKTFHEYCAAAYLSSLIETEKEKFDSYLDQINNDNIDEMKYLMKFCCGQNIKSAELVIGHVVKLKQNHREPWYLPLLLLYESELSLTANPENIKTLQACVAPSMKQPRYIVQTAEIFNAIKYFTETYSTERNCWMSKIKELSCRNVIFSTELVTCILERFTSLERFEITDHALNVLMVVGYDNETNKVLDVEISESVSILRQTDKVGEVDSSPLCKGLKKLSVKPDPDRFQMNVSALIDLLHIMSALISLSLTNIHLIGNVDISTPIVMRSLQELYVQDVFLTSNAMMQILDCMPSLMSLTINAITIDVSPSVCYVLSKVNMNLLLQLLGHASSLKTLNLVNIDLTSKRQDVNILPVQILVKEPQVKNCSMSTNTIMGLLDCTPAVTTFALDEMELTGEADDSISPSCKSLKELQMKKCSMSANTMMRLLDCTPAVTTFALDEMELTGKADDSISPSCKSLKELQMKKCSMSANTMMRLLDCTPAVTTFALDEMELTGEADDSISPSCKSLKELQMKKCSMSANTMMRLLDCTPAVTTFALDEMELTGEADDSISPSWKSLKELQMKKCSMSANMMMRLLDCTPAVTTLTLDEMELTGEADDSISPSCKSLKELQMKKCSMSANTMMRLLDCTPAVTTLTLDGTELTGELVDGSISPSCELLEECTMKAFSASLDMVLHLLKCISVMKLTMEEVRVKGTISGRISLYKSQKELQMRKFSVSVDMIMRLLHCTPAVTTLTLIEMELTGEVDDSISPSCESLKELQMKKCSMSANTMMRLLDCTPAVTTFALDEMELTGEADDSISPSCKSLKELQMKKCSMSANTMMRLLDCTPAVTTLTLDGTELTGELVDGSISPSCELLEECTMIAFSASLDMVLHLLKCISVMKLTMEEVRVKGTITGRISLYKSQQELHMRQFSVSVDKMTRLLHCTPAVTTLKLIEMELPDNVNVSISPSCKSLKELQTKACSVSANTLMRLLGCMPSITTLTLDRIHLTDEPGKPERDQMGHVRRTFISGITIQTLLSCVPSITKLTLNGFNLLGKVDKSLQWESLQEFTMEDCFQETITMMELLSCMPSVAKLTIIRFDLVCNVDKSLQCESLQEFQMEDCFQETNTMMELLSCMPSVTKLTLIRFNLLGKVDKSLQFKSLQEFTMEDCFQETNKMMELLSCMPSVTKFTLNRFTLVANVDKSLQCGSLQELQMKYCSQDTNTMMGLLSCMPSVTKLTLIRVNLLGKVDKSRQCESLQEFTMEDCFQETNKMMELLSCMPSVTKLTLNRFTLVANVDKSLQCESLQELQMKYCSQDTNTVMGLLSCMPSITTLTLDRIHLTDEPGERKYYLMGYVERTYRTATLQRLLSCIPSVANVTLVGMTLQGNMDILPQDVTIKIRHHNEQREDYIKTRWQQR